MDWTKTSFKVLGPFSSLEDKRQWVHGPDPIWEQTTKFDVVDPKYGPVGSSDHYRRV